MRDTAIRSERLPFEAFLDVLVSNGFEIGVEQSARLQRLLGDLGPECDPHRLKTTLCPIFASSDAQQENFYQHFDRFFPELLETEPAGVGPSVPRSIRPRRRTKLWLTVAANLIWIGIVAYSGWRLVSKPVQPQMTAMPKNGGSHEQVFPIGSEYAPKSQPATVSIKLPPVSFRLALYLAVLGLALFELMAWLRRMAVLSRAPQRAPPSKWPPGSDSHGPRIYRGTQVLGIARRLRARELVESDEVDIAGTISRTVRSLGFVKFAFRFGSKRPEYLVLIERQSSQDHLAALFLELTEALRREGVLLDAFFYQGDAQVCHAAANNAPLFLEDLCSRFRERRVIVFGDGREFSNPYAVEPSRMKAALRSFKASALLSPTPLSEKTRLERDLDETFGAVLPASLDSLWLLSLAWGGTAAPVGRRMAQVPGAVVAPWDELRWEEKLPDYVADLRAYLGDDSFRWLCACAIHSQLYWELTLSLGAVTVGASCNEANVLRLCRLKWFRLGTMPVELREVLSRELDRNTETSVRGVVLDFLRDHPAPKGSFAETVQKSEVAGHEWQLPPDTASRIQQSRELTQLLAESHPKTLDRLIPRTVRGWFFRQSVPDFGLSATLRVVLAVASSALVGFGVLGFASIPPVREWSQYHKVLSSPIYRDSKGKCTPAHPPRFRTASGYIESGSQYFADNNYDCAGEAYSLAITLDPSSAAAYIGRAAATVRAEQHGSPLGARQDLETAIRLNKKASRAYYWLGISYVREHEDEMALSLGRKAVELDPADAYPHNVIGRALDDLKRFDEARREYREALRLDPRWAVPQNNIGSTYVHQDRDDLAIPAFRKAIRIDPYLTLAGINLGKALDRQKKIDEAIVEYTKVIEKNPGARDAYTLRATDFGEKADYRAAWADADYLVRNSPDADAFVARGYFYSELGDNTRAIADYTEAIRRRPDYSLAYHDRAFSYLELGHQRQAAADYRRVIELPGPDERKRYAQQRLDAMGLR